ncbi:amidohydrolase family protein [Olivibacter sp. XZL3]|uniref:amidohydrolase family protein n=1 Tax=Olivibacter sp. XZL3 TaxID=1735116 RepID=UPI001066B0CA|nr:amidohydrolase family protein [Olivibacter sp. XZL3]
MYKPLLLPLILLFFACTSGGNNDKAAVGKKLILKNATLIDGTGAEARQTDITIERGKITALNSTVDTAEAEVIDLSGKTVLPAFISAHVHIGTLKGTSANAENYTRKNILRQLQNYQQYGILHVLSMGTDRPLLFANQFYDSLKNGQLEGARLFSAGIGFHVPDVKTPAGPPMDLLYRPKSAAEVPALMDSLMQYKPRVVKIWVDDFGGSAKKMDRSVYQAVIQEAHKQQVPVVAHVYNLADARQLVADGVDVLGHSIRDQLVDDELLKQMKANKVAYIPTLTLDEFAIAYAGNPEWINDPFFKQALEPGVYEMLHTADYRTKVKEDPQYARNVRAFQHALANVQRIAQAGILIGLGTDSGASPVRVQGFSEHRELQLLVEAGLTPLQAISIATQNAAKILRIDDQYGTIEKGKVADLLVLSANPLTDIKNTQKIEGVLKAGKWVRGGND